MSHYQNTGQTTAAAAKEMMMMMMMMTIMEIIIIKFWDKGLSQQTSSGKEKHTNTQTQITNNKK